MADILVRNAPDTLVDDLKTWAERDRRSLRAQVLTILEDAVERRRRHEEFIRASDEIRERLARTGRDFGDSVDLIREDRER